MKNTKFKNLANGEKSISTKMNKFNSNLDELIELKGRIEISSENKELDERYNALYHTKLYDLKNLFQEIEEDNIVYFFGTLDSVVASLKNKIDLL